MHTRITTVLCAALVAGSFASTTIAAARQNADNDNKDGDQHKNGTAMIKKLTNDQVQINQTFDAPKGLTGYVIQPKQGSPGQKQVVFTNDDKYLIIGNVVTPEGENLTQTYTSKYVTSEVAKTAYQELQNLHWVTEGSDQAEHKLYVLFDPNCVYCQMLYKEIHRLDLIKDQKVQIRWVPVGFLKPSSKGMAAAIFNADNPLQALEKDEKQFNPAKEQGGITPLKQDNDNKAVTESFRKVKENTKFFTRYDFGGTPTLIYQQQNGEYGYMPGFVKGKKLVKLIDGLKESW